MNRAAGIFLHPTSLPSKFGIGDLGEAAYTWIDLLSTSKQLFWQVCPLGPTGYGDSPYQSLCSFAGNWLLLSPEKFFELELLTRQELDAFPTLPEEKVDFGRVIAEKEKLFEKAFERFVDTKEFEEYCDRERYWLDDFALFKVIKERQGNKSWVEWEAPLKLRFPAALEEVAASERRAIRYQKFQQFMFHTQWTALRAYAKSKGVRIIGDVPYFVAFDSSDTWASPELYELDESGNPLRVAGVPPDYFSQTGQLWGNPLYQWDNMRQDGYAWWIKRVRKSLELVDYLRLDHFRGFESYWAVPAGSATAVKGTWERGPGFDFFAALKNALGAIPIIAEDLGEITHGVEELRRKVGLLGMKVLQFAFDGELDNPYLPYNVAPDSIMYTGTHDNDTSCGWFTSLDEEDRRRVIRYLGCSHDDFIERFLRLAYSSPSRLCMIPAQDLLGLPEGNRMNTPGKENDCWTWRMLPRYLAEKYFAPVGDYTTIYGREASETFVL
jgi:4-alpha-glucanotransferase